MAMPHAKKLRKEQQKQQSKARKEADSRKEAPYLNSDGLECVNCGRRFKNLSRCAIHEVWCINDRKCAQCPDDNTKYATDRALHRHWDFYHKFLGCSFCDARAFSQDREQHERESHPKEFQAREYRRQHANELQKCSFCRVKLFPQDKEQHQRDSHPMEFQDREMKRKYLRNCSFCQTKVFPWERKQHEFESHPIQFQAREQAQNDDGLHQCHFCKTRLFSEDVNKHERHKHPMEYEYKQQHRRSKKPEYEYKEQHHRDKKPSSSESGQTHQKVVRTAPMPDHYKTLGIARDAPAEEIERAARKMRINCHPDKLKRKGTTPEEDSQIDEHAKTVGWAADILCNKVSKEKYDGQWNAFHT